MRCLYEENWTFKICNFKRCTTNIGIISSTILHFLFYFSELCMTLADYFKLVIFKFKTLSYNSNNKIFFIRFFCSPWGALVIVQIFDFRFLADLHVLVSGESKKHKISMMSGCLLVS